MNQIILFTSLTRFLFLPIDIGETKYFYDLWRWKDYYEVTVNNKKPYETLKRAVASFSGPGLAVDLGCGAGRDTRYLAEKGWQVLAVDAEGTAEPYLWKMVGEYSENVQFIQSDFEHFEFPEATMLINASYSLPFCHPAVFPEVMHRLKESLISGGRFSGHFLGPEDSWNDDTDLVFLSREEVEALFEGFEMEYYLEEKADRKGATSGSKHWHIHHIVARKL